MISPGIDSNTQSFFFSKGAGGSLLLTQGWLPPETWGVKNREIVSEIRLPSITMYKWEHVSLDFWCRCLGEVCVYVNGKCMATWHPSDLFSHRKLDDLTDFLFIEGGFLFVHFYTKRRADLSIQSCWVNGGKFNNVTSSLLNIEEPLADSIVQTPLFITGIPRSGTSVLYKVLNQALSVENSNLIESFFFSWGFSCFKNKFCGDCSSAFLGKDMSSCFDQVLQKCDGAPNYNDILRLARYYYQLAVKQCWPSRVIDKTPDHIFYWRAILEAFPDARIIFCSRTAVDVFSSFRKRSQEDKSKTPNSDMDEWLTIECDSFAHIYTEYIRAARDLMENSSESVFVVNYDKFVARDVSLLRGLSDFVGCQLSRLYDALDMPIIANDQVKTALRGGMLVENCIDIYKYLNEAELKTLRGLQSI